MSRLLADQLGASVQFRADGNYDIGSLLLGVQKRLGDLLGKAASAAHSWGKLEQHKALLEEKERLSTCNGSVAVEQWAINKAVHYNEWADFGKNDFTPVVTAFRELLAYYRCKSCDSWLYVAYDGEPDSLCCGCGDVLFKLRNKPKVGVPGRAFPVE